MKSSLLALAVAFLATTPAGSPDVAPAARPFDDVRASVPQDPTSPEPPVALVALGDPAPDFTWIAADNHPRRLRDLCAQGHVVLVFAPTDPTLAAMQRERNALLDLGVIPVAVVDGKPGAARGAAKRLGLAYTVIPDARRVIASQFNVLDAVSHRAVPSWFVIDRGGHVRGLARGSAPPPDLARTTATALGLPVPGVALPARTR